MSDLDRRVRLHAALADPAPAAHRRRPRPRGRVAVRPAARARHDLEPARAPPAHPRATPGLVTRRRSEADRRRAYLQLDPAPWPACSPAAPRLAVPRVVFVCTANTARSQLAAALWRRASPVPATSAGTHPADAVAPGAVAAARRHGLPLDPGAPRGLDDVLQPGTTWSPSATTPTKSSTGPTGAARPTVCTGRCPIRSPPAPPAPSTPPTTTCPPRHPPRAAARRLLTTRTATAHPPPRTPPTR